MSVLIPHEAQGSHVVSPYHFQDGTTRVTIETPEHDGKRFALGVSGPDGEIADKCRQLESIVFSQYFGDHRDKMIEEYAPYETGSEFIYVLDKQEGQLAGVVRIMTGTEPRDFKVIHDILGDVPDTYMQQFHPGFDSRHTCEIGTLAVASDYRKRLFRDSWHDVLGARVKAMLFHGLYQYSEQKDIEHWVTMFDEHAYQQLNHAGVRFKPLCGLPPMEYLGSDSSYPLYNEVSELAERVKDQRRLTYWVLAKGLGVTAVCDTAAIKV